MESQTWNGFTDAGRVTKMMGMLSEGGEISGVRSLSRAAAEDGTRSCLMDRMLPERWTSQAADAYSCGGADGLIIW